MEMRLFFFPLQCKTCSEPKQMTSSSAIYSNPNLIKPIPVKPGDGQQRGTRPVRPPPPPFCVARGPGPGPRA